MSYLGTPAPSTSEAGEIPQAFIYNLDDKAAFKVKLSSARNLYLEKIVCLNFYLELSLKGKSNSNLIQSGINKRVFDIPAFAVNVLFYWGRDFITIFAFRAMLEYLDWEAGRARPHLRCHKTLTQAGNGNKEWNNIYRTSYFWSFKVFIWQDGQPCMSRSGAPCYRVSSQRCQIGVRNLSQSQTKEPITLKPPWWKKVQLYSHSDPFEIVRMINAFVLHRQEESLLFYFNLDFWCAERLGHPHITSVRILFPGGFIIKVTHLIWNTKWMQ